MMSTINYTRPLNQDIIRDFASLLGAEALEYLNAMNQIERVSSEVFEAYKGLYNKYQTIPVLFLSYLPGKAIYVWQVNRLCPIKKRSHYMVLDTRSIALETINNISILMLAKIVPEEGEEMIGGGFIGGRGEIYVQSRIGKEQLIIRQYKLTDLVEIARINPFKQEILANNRHYSKLVIKGAQTTVEAKENLDISLWKRKSTKEIEQEMIGLASDEMQSIVREKIVQRNASFESNILAITRLNIFNLVLGTQNGVTLLFDSYTSSVLAWREDSFFISSFENKKVFSGKAEKNSLFVNEKSEMREIIFETFPKVEVVTHSEVDYRIFYEWYGYSNGITFRPSNGLSSKLAYQDTGNPVYDVPISVINPHLEKLEIDLVNQHQIEKDKKANEDEKKEDEEEKLEEKPIKELDKIKSESKQKKTEKADHKTNIKSTKEMLQDIRAGIKAQPEGASRQAIELYSEIKTEKKRVEKQREKEKTQRKNNKSKNDDLY